MRTIVIIEKHGHGYIGTITDNSGSERIGVRCGLEPYDAAAKAAKFMIKYAASNPDGGDLMAPPEVLELVPEHLRVINNSR